MANKHGDFIWYELLCDDADAALSFYGELLAWTSEHSGQDNDYRILSARDADTGENHSIGGLLPLTADMKAGGASPLWLGYIGVDNVDSSARQLIDSGAKLMLPAFDIPGVGRIAMLSDPQGIPFYIMRGASDGTSLAFAFDQPRIGHCAWNELTTTDPDQAKQFYGRAFGWEKDDEMDMGPMGKYEFLRHQGQSGIFGAVMRKPAEQPTSMWNYYFRVADIDIAVNKISTLGGQVIQGPHEIPGGDFTINGIDPQGAPFALVGARKHNG